MNGPAVCRRGATGGGGSPAAGAGPARRAALTVPGRVPGLLGQGCDDPPAELLAVAGMPSSWGVGRGFELVAAGEQGDFVAVPAGRHAQPGFAHPGGVDQHRPALPGAVWQRPVPGDGQPLGLVAGIAYPSDRPPARTNSALRVARWVTTVGGGGRVRARRGQTDIRGLVIAGRAVRLERSAGLKWSVTWDFSQVAHSLAAGAFHALPSPCHKPAPVLGAVRPPWCPPAWPGASTSRRVRGRRRRWRSSAASSARRRPASVGAAAGYRHAREPGAAAGASSQRVRSAFDGR